VFTLLKSDLEVSTLLKFDLEVSLAVGSPNEDAKDEPEPTSGINTSSTIALR
jgi:hypothetical protein